MNKKASLAIILTAMLLADSLNGVRWQGTGTMNNTVISEIWTDLSTNIDTALTTNSRTGFNSFTKGLSDRLNARWDPAWNVVFILNSARYDSILYGYAFRNQWMWYNGVPNSVQDSESFISTLIVWKDYNCQDWKNIDPNNELSSFSTTKKNLIKAEISKMTLAGIRNDVWGTTFTMMNNLQQNSEFSSGGYSVIFNQDANCGFYGRICRVGNGFFNSLRELNFNPIFFSQTAGYVGYFYLFQTR